MSPTRIRFIKPHGLTAILAALLLNSTPFAAIAATEETARPNAPYQTPAFPGQTRAPIPAETESHEVTKIADGLDHPWALAFLPDGSLLITERPGTLRHVTAEGVISEPIGGVPEVHHHSQGGLLDVMICPDFVNNHRVYLTYSEPREGSKSGTAVATGTLNFETMTLENVERIFQQMPSWESRGHYGSRLALAPDGNLFITLGERMNEEPRQLAQSVDNHLGAVVRIGLDGSIPNDNPFVGQQDAEPALWSYGHRNPQAAASHPETGQLWVIEHGPRGGDELNRPEAGKNYGWPVITYGINYNGQPIGDDITAKSGMEQPVYYWDPVIAPSGMVFYSGEMFPSWKNDILVGGLASKRLVRLTMADNRVTGEEWLEMPGRVRDVAVASDGAVWIVTDENNGGLYRIH